MNVFMNKLIEYYLLLFDFNSKQFSLKKQIYKTNKYL